MTLHRATACVFCGSRSGNGEAYEAAAAALGRALGARDLNLVYGGGRVGLMGVVADATLSAGGEVMGVIPETLMQREVGHKGLTELHVVPNMHVRKRMMAERADVFIALPGGIGTLEELFEVWTWRQLGYHGSAIGLLDVNGYYERLIDFMQHTVNEGFVSRDTFATLVVDTDPGRLLDQLLAEPRGARLRLDQT